MSVFAFEPITEGTYKWKVYIKIFDAFLAMHIDQCTSLQNLHEGSKESTITLVTRSGTSGNRHWF